MRRDSETNNVGLVEELVRLRRRAVRQKRKIKLSTATWQEWSTTIDEIATLTQRLVSRPATDPQSLLANFIAILWLIEVNESLLDSGDLRRLRRFGRDLSGFAGGSQ